MPKGEELKSYLVHVGFAARVCQLYLTETEGSGAAGIYSGTCNVRETFQYFLYQLYIYYHVTVSSIHNTL